MAAGTFGAFPVDMVTDGRLGVRRLQVDVGQTGFWAGQEFRAFKELTVTATPLWVRFVVPSSLQGVILQDFRLSCYQGSIQFRSYRVGTPSGTWTSNPVWPNNGIPDIAGYVGAVTLDFGGTVTSPSQQSDGLVAYANESGKSNTTTVVGQHGERGLPAGTYYLEFSRLPGTTVDGLGVFSAVWEERTL